MKKLLIRGAVLVNPAREIQECGEPLDLLAVDGRIVAQGIGLPDEDVYKRQLSLLRRIFGVFLLYIGVRELFCRSEKKNDK